MNTIKESIIYEEIIKKSKFITFLHPVTSIEQIKKILQQYKNEHKDATHICYAYILDENTYKYYDDGEPSNSAGMPIYQALKNNKLIYVLCVVIRYFGGIKLGVGGLCHAYSNGALSSIKKSTIVEYKETNEYIVECDYSQFDSFTYYLEKKGIVINDKQFLDHIFITFSCDKESLEELSNNFPYLKITLVKFE